MPDQRSLTEPGHRIPLRIALLASTAIVLALACFRSGAALLPLNTAYTLPELEYFLADAEPALTLCRPKQLEAVRALGERLSLRAGVRFGLGYQIRLLRWHRMLLLVCRQQARPKAALIMIARDF